MLEESPTAFGSDYSETAARSPAYFRDRVTDTPDSFIFGAFRGGSLIGAAGSYREPEAKRRHIATVVGMFVHPDHRRRGLAGALLNAVLDRLREQPGLEYIRLAVTAGNTRALALYERTGFSIYGREPAALKVAGTNHDELLMSLRLR